MLLIVFASVIGVESRRDIERDVVVHKLTEIGEARGDGRHARVSRIVRLRCWDRGRRLPSNCRAGRGALASRH